jgi:hypothetical protein
MRRLWQYNTWPQINSVGNLEYWSAHRYNTSRTVSEFTWVAFAVANPNANKLLGHNKLYIVCVRPCFPSILSSAQVNDCVAIYGLHFANRTIYYLSVGHDQYWTFHVILNWSMLQMIMPWLAPLHQTHWPRSETWLSFLDTWRNNCAKKLVWWANKSQK